MIDITDRQLSVSITLREGYRSAAENMKFGRDASIVEDTTDILASRCTLVHGTKGLLESHLRNIRDAEDLLTKVHY